MAWSCLWGLRHCTWRLSGALCPQASARPKEEYVNEALPEFLYLPEPNLYQSLVMQQIQQFIFDLGQGLKERGHWSNINAAKVLPKGLGICFSKLASCWYCQWSGERPGPMAQATFIQPWQCHGMAMVISNDGMLACGMPMFFHKWHSNDWVMDWKFHSTTGLFPTSNAQPLQCRMYWVAQ